MTPPRSTQRTLVKIRVGRRARSYAQAGLLLAAFAAGFVLFAGVQVALCKHATPDRTVERCLTPKWSRR